jgi:hypothetical protein
MSWAEHYSALDRAGHRIAFGGIGLQKTVADIEDRVFACRFADVAVDRPVFITSLPRAGTTLLLELIAGLPEFAAHTPAHAVSSLPDVLERHLEGLPAKDDETRACA